MCEWCCTSCTIRVSAKVPCWSGTHNLRSTHIDMSNTGTEVPMLNWKHVTARLLFSNFCNVILFQMVGISGGYLWVNTFGHWKSALFVEIRVLQSWNMLSLRVRPASLKILCPHQANAVRAPCSTFARLFLPPNNGHVLIGKIIYSRYWCWVQILPGSAGGHEVGSPCALIRRAY